jgi:hypothetical protein
MTLDKSFEDLLEVGQTVTLISGHTGDIKKLHNTTIPKRYELDNGQLYKFSDIQMVYEFRILYFREGKE